MEGCDVPFDHSVGKPDVDGLEIWQLREMAKCLLGDGKRARARGDQILEALNRGRHSGNDHGTVRGSICIRGQVQKVRR